MTVGIRGGVCAVVLTLMFWQGKALAQVPRPLEQARWFLAVDRLTSVGGWSVSHTELTGVEVTEAGTYATLVGGATATGASVPLNPYAVPRLSLDYRTDSPLTFGLGISGIITSGDVTAEKGSASASATGDSRWLLGATPRLGYLMRVTDGLLLWGRAGATIAAQHGDSSIGSNKALQASVDFDGAGLFRLWGPVAVSTTLALALPMAGRFTTNLSPTVAASLGAPTHRVRDFSMTSFAVQLGLVAAL